MSVGVNYDKLCEEAHSLLAKNLEVQEFSVRFRLLCYPVLGVVTEALGYRELHQGSWMYQGYCLLALAG